MAPLSCNQPAALLETKALPSYAEVVCRVLITAAAQASVFINSLTSTFAIGHVEAVDEADQIAMQAGFGLALTVQCVVVFGPGAGIAGACDTVVSQAAGEGDMLKCALCFGQIRTLLMLHWLMLVVPLGLAQDHLLVALGFESATARYASLYFRILLPGIMFRSQNVLMRRFLACLGQPWPTPWAAALSVLVHSGLVGSLGSRVTIDALAWITNVSEATPCLVLMGYLIWYPENFKLQREWLQQHAFVFHGLRDILWLGLNNTLQTTAEELAIQTFTFMSIDLGNVSVAAVSICYNVSASIYAVGIGCSATAAGLVGGAIGRNCPCAARRITWRCVIVAAFLGVPVVVGLLCGAAPLAAWFSEQPEIKAESTQLLWILCISQPIEFINLTLCSVLRAVKRPQLSPMVILFVYYLVMIPLAWVLAFPAGHGTFGMWLSYTVSCFVACGILVVAVWQTSFEAAAKARATELSDMKQRPSFTQVPTSESQPSLGFNSA
eukprot:TRINITY_DN67071_c0_g1_i1.p1 TRINITY_DN67071_c0_g1~~TRINITY_DN67071_c0_g1_i1.p1  ORF type:complete len:495 (+),score=49.58 TRINITY_DN67071_c0_g1_i1:102-1586(+)